MRRNSPRSSQSVQILQLPLHLRITASSDISMRVNRLEVRLDTSDVEWHVVLRWSRPASDGSEEVGDVYGSLWPSTPVLRRSKVSGEFGSISWIACWSGGPWRPHLAHGETLRVPPAHRSQTVTTSPVRSGLSFGTFEMRRDPEGPVNSAFWGTSAGASGRRPATGRCTAMTCVPIPHRTSADPAAACSQRRGPARRPETVQAAPGHRVGQPDPQGQLDLERHGGAQTRAS